ncbi:hypothetical protein N1851_015441 [Merluccius polli]|uniref:Peptidase A2 domain-containing protein n=1 Tax=Merluccius polli TaxID=89951 RepID=A0AA47MT27_MERPO|nr:hypothetical protein N1851_015441 [Merluccius polli]
MDTQALLDTGSVVTLLCPKLAGGRQGEPIEVACVHGDTRTYETCHVVVRTPPRDVYGTGRDRAPPPRTPTHREGLPNIPQAVELQTGCSPPLDSEASTGWFFSFSNFLSMALLQVIGHWGTLIWQSVHLWQELIEDLDPSI